MLLTPILLDLEPIGIPINQKTFLDRSLLTRPALLNFYYLQIYPPRQGSLESLPTGSIKVSIPYTPSALKGKVRLQLAPSIGDGLNACYRVEYWQHQKPFYPDTVVTRPPVKSIARKLKQEYWLVPTSDGTFLCSEEEFISHRPRWNSSNSEKVILTRTSENSLLSYLGIIQIQSIRLNGVSVGGYNLIDTSAIWSPPLDETDPIAPVIRLDLAATTPVISLGSEYEVTYVAPQTYRSILFQPR